MKIENRNLSNNKTIVCTVFEGHYHLGVAALVNSLYINGFEGKVWAAYKGVLPNWAIISQKENGYEVMNVCKNLDIHFLKLSQNIFLPYYKPQLMLSLFDTLEPEANQVIYIDCDIVVKCDFSYFEKWSKFGIMLCEDVNSPISTTDPLRFEWEDYFKKFELKVRRDNNQYVNGGFIGLHRSAKDFLKTWVSVQDLILENLNKMHVDVKLSHLSNKNSGLKDRTYMFYRTDQDALNIAKDITSESLSIADSSSMDFKNVGFVMSHAATKKKPWEKNYLKFVLKNGQRPSNTDRVFWDYTQYPIAIFNKRERFFKKLNLKIACALGRIFG